jgi:hypothetical protein
MYIDSTWHMIIGVGTIQPEKEIFQKNTSSDTRHRYTTSIDLTVCFFFRGSSFRDFFPSVFHLFEIFLFEIFPFYISFRDFSFRD